MKRILSLILAVSLLLVAMPSPETAKAATSAHPYPKITREGYTWWNSITFHNPTSGGSYTEAAGSAIPRTYDSESWHPMYCIEPGAKIVKGSTIYNVTSWSSYWGALGDAKRAAIQRIMYYGYPNYPGRDSIIAYWYATQIIIWEYVMGERDTNTGACTNRRIFNNVHAPSNSGFSDAYWELDWDMNKYHHVESFMSNNPGAAPIYQLSWNGSHYSNSLTDTSGMHFIWNLSFSCPGVWFNYPSNNVVENYTDDIIDGTQSRLVTATRNAIPNRIGSAEIWYSSNYQSLYYGTVDIPMPSQYYRVFTDTRGYIWVHLSTENGDVGGKSVHFQGNGQDWWQTTDGNGNTATGSLYYGNYTITVYPGNQFDQPASQTVWVNPARTTYANFSANLKRGRVRILKQDSCQGGYVSGARYRVYTVSGAYTGVEITTDASQWIYSPWLTYGNYFLQESAAPSGYALDSRRYYFDVTDSWQDIPAFVYDSPTSDVYPAFITPNAPYREGAEVVVAYSVYNNSLVPHTSSNPLSVTFTGSAVGATNNFTQTKSVVVPAYSNNLVYFKYTIPKGATKVTFGCNVANPPGVVEVNTANNSVSNTFNVQAVPTSATSNTTFGNAPSGYSVPNSGTAIPTTQYTGSVSSSASWDQWVYANGGFSKVTYGAKLSTAASLSPDSNAKSSSLTSGVWNMRSGYGVALDSKTTIVQNGSNAVAPADSYTSVQSGNIYFPEFSYSSVGGGYRTLDNMGSGTLAFGQNPYALNLLGQRDNRRVHFIPIWFPDGNYIAKQFIYDAWTPAGMLSAASNLPSIKIGGSIYDDWYVDH